MAQSVELSEARAGRQEAAAAKSWAAEFPGCGKGLRRPVRDHEKLRAFIHIFQVAIFLEYTIQISDLARLQMLGVKKKLALRSCNLDLYVTRVQTILTRE